MNPHDMEVYGAVKVGERGQVVIPVGAREKLGIKAGDSLLVISTPHNDGLAMIKVEVVRKMIGKMNLGLSQIDGDGGRRPSKKRGR
ncbi:MAG: AbrB/MazE/SpoVT family DNA-binding domain-containing protein [Thermoplasmata archaeon]